MRDRNCSSSFVGSIMSIKKAGRPAINSSLKLRPLSFTLSPEIIAALKKERNKSKLISDLLIKHYKIKT